jgi:7,8-dihydropterin-6-yl-methyl-4-(beta-D-ribofuranosyl)aminobenzene 5'-phosphate synthase
MVTTREFGEVEKAWVTILVDNKANLIVESNERVQYFEDAPLLAEHGFSALIRLAHPDLTILWDAGVSRVALMENLKRMKIDPASIQKIALSHGHGDHFAAMTDVLNAMELGVQEKEWDEPWSGEEIEHWIEQKRLPLVAHPAAFRERWWVKDDGKKVGPFLPAPAQAWEAAGASLLLSAAPFQLADGCWTTGYIPRQSFERSGRSEKLRYRQGDLLLPDDMEEDQAIVIHVKGKGLVVVSGCAHSGIVNTVRYAQEMSGIEQVYAILGGFHLAAAEREEMLSTVDAIAAIRPQWIIPCHCTGFLAMCQFATQMPDQFIEGVVGATFKF